MKRDFISLLRLCKSNGIKVVFLGNKVLHDYAGMNPEAAKLMDFTRIMEERKNQIELDKNQDQETQYRNLKHELNEWYRMLKGWKYGPAHLDSLKAETKKLPDGIVKYIGKYLKNR